MKQEQIEIKTLKTVFVAEDGTQFDEKGECEKYEKTFACAMRSHIQGIALRITAEDNIWNNGSCDNTVYSLIPHNEEDLLRIKQMVAGMGAHKSTLDRITDEYIGKVVLIIAGYENDWVSVDTLERLVKDATDDKYTICEKEADNA